MPVPAIQEFGSSQAVHEMTFWPGTTIQVAAPILVAEAERTQGTVAARINNVPVTVDPGTTVEQVLATYTLSR